MVDPDTYVYNHSWQSSMDVLRRTKGKDGVNVPGEVFSHILNPPPFRAREDMRPTQQIPVTTTHVVKVTDADWATVNRERAKNKEPLLTKEEYVRSLISDRVQECITPEVDTSIVYREGLRPPKDFVDKYNSGQRLDTNEALAFLAQELGPLFNNTRDRSANVPLNIEVERDFANRELIISNTDESKMPINPRFRASLHLKMPNTSGQGNWLPNVASADVHHNGKIYHLDLSRPDHLRVVLEMIRPRHVPTQQSPVSVLDGQGLSGSRPRFSQPSSVNLASGAETSTVTQFDGWKVPKSSRTREIFKSSTGVEVTPREEGKASFYLLRSINETMFGSEKARNIISRFDEILRIEDVTVRRTRMEELDKYYHKWRQFEEKIASAIGFTVVVDGGMDDVRAGSIFEDIDSLQIPDQIKKSIKYLYHQGILVPFVPVGYQGDDFMNQVVPVINREKFEKLPLDHKATIINIFRSLF